MIKTLTISKDQQPTDEQLQEIEEAKKYPIEFDEDCPELSSAMAEAFRRVDAVHDRRKHA